MNAPDEKLHNLYVLYHDADRGNRGERGVPDGMSTSDGDDAKRSSDASTSHVPNSGERTTNPGNIPNTKDYAMRTNLSSRTSRISADDTRKRVR